MNIDHTTFNVVPQRTFNHVPSIKTFQDEEFTKLKVGLKWDLMANDAKHQDSKSSFRHNKFVGEPKKRKVDRNSSGISSCMLLLMASLLAVALINIFATRDEVLVAKIEQAMTTIPAANLSLDILYQTTESIGGTVLDDDVAPSSFSLPSTVHQTLREKMAWLARSIRTKTPRAYRNPLNNCSLTSQVRIERYDTHWVLQTLDGRGNYKTKGGDEFYVTYTEASNRHKNSNATNPTPTAVARVTDQQDGSYRLDFVTVPMTATTNQNADENVDMKRGTLHVVLQYSCGIGQIPQPVKDKWPTGGSSAIAFSISNVPRPYCRVFKPPVGVDLSSFDVVISFGDSLMGHLAGYRHYQENIWWTGNIKQEISTSTLPDALQKLESSHGKRLRRKDQSIALVLGSAMWDLLASQSHQGADFSDHLQACRELIESVRKTYPSVSIFWKSPSAGHRHRAVCGDNRECQYRLRYMSTSRVEYLHEHQTKLMRELSVPVLDIYEGTYLSAHWTIENDAMHYEEHFDREVLSWFYNNTNS